jgi:hypothetical protein
MSNYEKNSGHRIHPQCSDHRKRCAQKSAQRLVICASNTLLAEYGEDVKIAIKAFRNGKSDYAKKLCQNFSVSPITSRWVGH